MSYQLFQNWFNPAEGLSIFRCDAKGNPLSLAFRTTDRRQALNMVASFNSVLKCISLRPDFLTSYPMTKKHFIAIAAGFKARLKAVTISADRPEFIGLLRGEVFNCASMFADVAKSNNARFNRERFLAACGF